MKPTALFVTHVCPDPNGVGAQQRAWALLIQVRERFTTIVAVVADNPEVNTPSAAFAPDILVDVQSVADPAARLAGGRIPAEIRTSILSAMPMPWAARGANARAARQIADAVADKLDSITVVFVHRLQLAPLAPALRDALPSSQTFVLDLDDDEVITNLRLAWLAREANNEARAIEHKVEAHKFDNLLRRARADFDVIAVCSALDRDRLTEARTSRTENPKFVILPNVTHRLAVDRRPRDLDGELRLLFVGALNYEPNADAILACAKLALPRIRALWPGVVKFDVVGRGDPDPIQVALAGTGANVHGPVEDLAPCYAEADMTLIPLRAGGGTRIKILEAFAFGLPVVATSVAVEGLDVEDGRHLLIRDDPQSMAEGCVALARAPARAAALAKAARALLDQRYGPRGMAKGFQEIFGPI